ncbi:MAG TPA: hypothetical protein IAB39_04645 [Candidatus Onthovicinus excrementipullorum]|nr:hypothetical protein [Candidatus Onthovicinus excrementipullorum]
MAAVFKWIAWLVGTGLTVYGFLMAARGEISGLAVFGVGLCLIGVGVAIHLLANINLRVSILYSDHRRDEVAQEEKE